MRQFKQKHRSTSPRQIDKQNQQFPVLKITLPKALKPTTNLDNSPIGNQGANKQGLLNKTLISSPKQVSQKIDFSFRSRSPGPGFCPGIGQGYGSGIGLVQKQGNDCSNISNITPDNNAKSLFLDEANFYSFETQLFQFQSNEVIQSQDLKRSIPKLKTIPYLPQTALVKKKKANNNANQNFTALSVNKDQGKLILDPIQYCLNDTVNQQKQKIFATVNDNIMDSVNICNPNQLLEGSQQGGGNFKKGKSGSNESQKFLQLPLPLQAENDFGKAQKLNEQLDGESNLPQLQSPKLLPQININIMQANDEEQQLRNEINLDRKNVVNNNPRKHSVLIQMQRRESRLVTALKKYDVQYESIFHQNQQQQDIQQQQQLQSQNLQGQLDLQNNNSSSNNKKQTQLISNPQQQQLEIQQISKRQNNSFLFNEQLIAQHLINKYEINQVNNMLQELKEQLVNRSHSISSASGLDLNSDSNIQHIQMPQQNNGDQLEANNNGQQKESQGLERTEHKKKSLKYKNKLNQRLEEKKKSTIRLVSQLEQQTDIMKIGIIEPIFILDQNFDEEKANNYLFEGLKINKEFSELEFIEGDLAPEEWIQKCKEIVRPFDARCPIYKDRKYVWVKVKVLEWNNEKNKYTVKILESNLVKQVGRLSLIFREESTDNLMQRINSLRLKLKIKRDNERFIQYLDSIPNDDVETMPTRMKKNIFSKCNLKKHHLNIENAMTEKLLSSLTQDVELEFLRTNKKFIQITAMADPRNARRYADLNIELRSLQEPIYPYNTLITEIEPLLTYLTSEVLRKRCFILKKECLRALQIVKERTYLSGESIQFLMMDFTKMMLPISLSDLIAMQREYVKRIVINMQINFREYIIGEIQDNLRIIYRLLEIDSQQYQVSEVRRFMKRVELDLQNFLTESIFRKTCQQWLNFFKCFVYPSDIQSFQAMERKASEQIDGSKIKQFFQQKNLSKIPFLKVEIDLISSQQELLQSMQQSERSSIANPTNKKQQFLQTQNSSNINNNVNTKNSSPRSSAGDLVPSQANMTYNIITFPKKDDFIDGFINVLTDIQNYINEFQSIQKQLVPLSDALKKPITEVYFSDVADIITQMKSQIDEAWTIQIESLIEKYANFLYIFDIQQIQQIDALFPEEQTVIEKLEKDFLETRKQARASIQFQIVPKATDANTSARSSQTTNPDQGQPKKAILKVSSNSSAQQQQMISRVSSIFPSDFQEEAIEEEVSAEEEFKQKIRENIHSHTLMAVKEIELRSKIDQITKLIQKIEKLTTKTVCTPTFLVNIQQCKDKLLAKANELLNTALNRVHTVLCNNILRIDKEHQDIYDKLNKTIKNEDELVQIQKTIQSVDYNADFTMQQILKLKSLGKLLSDFYFTVDEVCNEKYWILYTWPNKLKAAIINTKKVIEQREKKFNEDIAVDKAAFIQKIIKLQKDFEVVRNFSNYQLAKDYNIEAQNLFEHIKETIYTSKALNRREKLLNLSITPYPMLVDMGVKGKPYIKFWEVAFDFQLDRQEWMMGLLIKQNYSVIEKKMDNYFKEISKIQRSLQEGNEGKYALKACNSMRKDLEALKEKLWLIELLTLEAMLKRPQNFKEMFNSCEMPNLEMNDDITLQQLLELGLHQNRQTIEEVCRRAEKQYTIEKKLNETFDKFRDLHFDIIPYKNTGSFVLKNVEDIQDTLAEIITQVIMMKSSPFIKPIIKRVAELEQRIQVTQDTIEEWLKCQRNWMYLEVIFNGEDIKTKLPSETRRFFDVDRFWRNTMISMLENASIWDLDADRLKTELDYNNRQLNIVQRALSEYLEQKRSAFPRFYFLSDEDLLDILSRSRDPEAFQRHLSKCFEAINSLELSDKANISNCKLLSMRSLEGESIPFADPITLTTDSSVEKWMTEIEKMMRRTLREKLAASADDRMIKDSEITQKDHLMHQSNKKVKFNEWLSTWPGQISLLVEIATMTQHLEEAIVSHNLLSHIRLVEQHLNFIIELARTRSSDIERSTCSTLIIHDLHMRDSIVELNASTNGSVTKTDFSWLKTQRYYFEYAGGTTSGTVVTSTIALGASTTALGPPGFSTVTQGNAEITDKLKNAQVQENYPQLNILPPKNNTTINLNIVPQLADTQSKFDSKLININSSQPQLITSQNQLSSKSTFALESARSLINAVTGMNLQIINHTVQYGFEYLGNTSRLVITPLTDRCFRTLFSAYQYYYGGAPEGPAGTGKTETVKDLAKSCGMHCVVFNASDGLNYLAMQKFFKGLASSGSWCCFDEFNRIDPEVLSVVAQMIMSIQTALRERRKVFAFEGQDTRLQLTCTINITMNPGYQGRSELPDNLKALFRPVAMMVADYAMIAEIFFYSLGFMQSNEISKKIVTSLRLAQQQLSSQDHYDFGMRNLKAILLAAGKMRHTLHQSEIDSDLIDHNENAATQQQNAQLQAEEEQKLALKALLSVNLPKFTKDDSTLFIGIASDLFTGQMEKQKSEQQNFALYKMVKHHCKKKQIMPTDIFLQKCQHLFETTMVRHGIMLVGAPASGKTTVLEIVKGSINERVGDTKDENELIELASQNIRKIELFKINPKSINSTMLYGIYDQNTKVWTDGVLALTIRSYLETNLDKGTQANFAWIVFDGPVDAVWIENMNTVLDDNKKLCLNSGEIIKLTPYMLSLFECEDLVHASPATVSRCGMVFMESDKVGWDFLLDAFFLQDRIAAYFATQGEELQDAVLRTMMMLSDVSLQIIKNLQCRPVLPLSKVLFVKNFVRLLTILLIEELKLPEQSSSISPQKSQANQIIGNSNSKLSFTGIGNKLSSTSPEKQPILQRKQSLLQRKMSVLQRKLSVIIEQHDTIYNLVIFALIWSFGASLDEQGRKIYNRELKDLLFEKHISKKFHFDYGPYTCDDIPSIQSSFDQLLHTLNEMNKQQSSNQISSKTSITPYSFKEITMENADIFSFQYNNGHWEPWVKQDSISFGKRKATLTSEKKASVVIPHHKSLIVQTAETQRFQYFFNFFVKYNQHLLVTGPTGTGKTITIQSELLANYNNTTSSYLIVNFSGHSKAPQVQQSIESRMTFRKRKMTFGPEERKERLVLFLDDVNMPTPEQYGAQPPLELIRQWLDCGGWYDLGSRTFKNFYGMVIVAAMMPRNPPTMRFLRYFNVLYIEPFEKDSLMLIFSKLIRDKLTRLPFSENVLALQSVVIEATIELYNLVRNTPELLPTPKKMHYLINLRDIQRICQGLTLANPKVIQHQKDLLKLWVHECQRVFRDRLVNLADQVVFDLLIRQLLYAKFNDLDFGNKIDKFQSVNLGQQIDQEIFGNNRQSIENVKQLAKQYQQDQQIKKENVEKQALKRDKSIISENNSDDEDDNASSPSQSQKSSRKSSKNPSQMQVQNVVAATKQSSPSQSSSKEIKGVEEESHNKLDQAQEINGDNPNISLGGETPLFFSSFLEITQGETKIIDCYAQVSSQELLFTTLKQYLDDYNQSHTQNQMNLVMFEDASYHIIKIVRITSFNQGHALLLGEGGSGRSSLARLAAFILGMDLTTLQQGELWRDQVKKIIQQVGSENKKVVFFVNDTQIFDDAMLEDICHIMNNGEVPELFTIEEKAKLIEEMDSNNWALLREQEDQTESAGEDFSPMFNNGGGVVVGGSGGGGEIEDFSIKAAEAADSHSRKPSGASGKGAKVKLDLKNVGGQSKQMTLNFRFEKFKRFCKNNLNILIAMSPVGAAIRYRLRAFPALINCATINWFMPWPESAYRSAAKHLIESNSIFYSVQADSHPLTTNTVAYQQEVYQQQQHMQQSLDVRSAEKIQDTVIGLLVETHMFFQQASDDLQSQLRRKIYITPMNFIRLVGLLNHIISEFQHKNSALIERYERGVEKIIQTENDIANMRKDLEVLQVKLESLSKENQRLLENLETKQKEADQKKYVCQVEEEETQLQREEANKLQAECKSELDRVVPLLKEAAEALQNISRDDLTKMKSYANPPEPVRVVMEGVCYALQVDQNVKWQPIYPGSEEKIQNFWEYSKKYLLNEKLIKIIKEYKEDKIYQIPLINIEKLRSLIKSPLFEKDKVFQASTAAGNFSMWLRAMLETYSAMDIVMPKKLKLKEAEEDFKRASELLLQKKAALAQILEVLTALQSDYTKASQEKEDLSNKVTKCRKQLVRAEKLISGLASEKEAWRIRGQDCRNDTETILSDSVLCAVAVAYYGVFPQNTREQVKDTIQQQLNAESISVNRRFSLQSALCDPLTIGSWTSRQRLPNDQYSIDNAIIIKNADHWPVCIDPQVQANPWIKEMEKANQLLIINPNTPINEISLQIESALQLGYPCLLENFGETVQPPLLEPVALKQFQKSGSALNSNAIYFKVKLGEKLIEGSRDFRMYMTTKLQNPVYAPEIASRVLLVNFIVTAEGLEDQVLNIVVKVEEPDKDLQRIRNVNQLHENKVNIDKTEKYILQLITQAKGDDLLSDEQLIDALQDSKNKTFEIREKQDKLEKDMRILNETRNFYSEVACIVAALFFVFMDLANVEHMYQFSLDWFISLFEKSIADAPNKYNQELRCRSIFSTFLTQLYQISALALLENHKLLFSFMISIKVMLNLSKLSQQELRFFSVGSGILLSSITKTTSQLSETIESSTNNTNGFGPSTNSQTRRFSNLQQPLPKFINNNQRANPAPHWLTAKQWTSIQDLCLTLPESFTPAFLKEFCENTAKLEAIFESNHVHNLVSLNQSYLTQSDRIQLPFSTSVSSALTLFQKLILIRILRPDMLILAIQNLIVAELGAEFIVSPPFDIDAMFADSKNSTPIVFILSSGGTDPQAQIRQFAEKLNFHEKLIIQSLGQGQQEKAEVKVREAMKLGEWVFLQNCHLAPSFMPILERIMERCRATSHQQPTVQENFRLWLTTNSTVLFPVQILQHSIKIRISQQYGLKNLLRKGYSAIELDKQLQSAHFRHPIGWQRLIFGLIFFHAVVQERKKFGPIGWNKPYEFTLSDLSISMNHMLSVLDACYLTTQSKISDQNLITNNDPNSQININQQALLMKASSIEQATTLNNDIKKPIQLAQQQINPQTTNNSCFQSSLSWESMHYMIGEINYGGRVTDQHDLRLMLIILKNYLNPLMMSEKLTNLSILEQCKFNTKCITPQFEEMLQEIQYRPEQTDAKNDLLSKYIVPPITKNGKFWTEQLETIKDYPNEDPTELFGMHLNAHITGHLFETNQLLSTILSLLPRNNKVEDKSRSPEILIREQCEIFLKMLPISFDEEDVSRRLPIRYNESMNTVLHQEVKRYNKLIYIVRSSLTNIIDAIEGFQTMNDEIEKSYNKIYDKQVPELWKKHAYSSVKPLASWFTDLLDRIKFLRQWIDTAITPSTFWISGFFFIPGFLTGVLQNYSRKNKHPIDNIRFEYVVLPELRVSAQGQGANIINAPTDGGYIFGLFLDGASWDFVENVLADPKPRQLFSEMPHIWLKPYVGKQGGVNSNQFECPLYITSQRSNDRYSTGVNSNWLLDISLSYSQKLNHSPQLWMLRGVALLTQLDD